MRAAESSDTAAGTRDAAMISLMSDCLLRISEAVAVDVEDVHAEGLQVYGKRTSDEDQGEILYICESTRRLIERYRTRAGIASGALFRRIRFQNHVTEERLGVKGARGAIQRRAAEAGIAGCISGHSLRIGSRGLACGGRGKCEGGATGGALAGADDAGTVCEGGAGGRECGGAV